MIPLIRVPLSKGILPLNFLVFQLKRKVEFGADTERLRSFVKFLGLVHLFVGLETLVSKLNLRANIFVRLAVHDFIPVCDAA